MKILFVTPFLPSPPRFGGQRRLDGLMRELATKHEVSILAFNRTDEHEHSSLAATREYCRRVVTAPNFDLTNTREKRSLQLRSLTSLHSFEHLLAARRADFQALLDRMLAETHYDVVQFEFAQMTAFQFASGAPGAPLFVLDEHNIEYDILRRTAQASENLPRRVYNSLNWRKLAREERSAWRRFDGITLTSRRDEQLLHEDFPSACSAVIPNGVDVSAFAPSTDQAEPGRLLFFGAINYYPNHDAVTYFLDQIFPKILKQHPSTKLCLVGPGGPELMQNRNDPQVEVAGMVPEVGPYIDQAAALVVPMRIGGGTRLKIVEALSKGKPVISTRLGAEGIDVVHGEHLLLADDPQEFADQVGRVILDPALAAGLGVAGRKLMEERYSWRKIASDLEEFFEVLRGRDRAQSSLNA